MGLFDRIGQTLGNLRPEQFLAAQAILNGDYSGAARIRASMAAEDRERQEAEATAAARSNQVRGAKHLGYDGNELAVLSASDLSNNYRQRIDPYSLAPGSRRYVPGQGERQEQVTEAPNPTGTQREYEYLRTIDPQLAESYLAKQTLIINQGIDPSSGQPFSEAINPRLLYNFGSNAPTPPADAPRIGPQSRSAVPTPPASAPRTFSYSGLPGDTETSGYRDPAHNRRVGGVPNSFHTRRDAQGNPMASDRVPPRGMSMDQYHAELRRRNPNLDVINEGDHVHLEPRGRPPANAPRRAEGNSVPRVSSPEELSRLRPGQLYRAPDGSLRRKS